MREKMKEKRKDGNGVQIGKKGARVLAGRLLVCRDKAVCFTGEIVWIMMGRGGVEWAGSLILAGRGWEWPGVVGSGWEGRDCGCGCCCFRAGRVRFLGRIKMHTTLLRKASKSCDMGEDFKLPNVQINK